VGHGRCFGGKFVFSCSCWGSSNTRQALEAGPSAVRADGSPSPAVDGLPVPLVRADLLTIPTGTRSPHSGTLPTDCEAISPAPLHPCGSRALASGEGEQVPAAPARWLDVARPAPPSVSTPGCSRVAAAKSSKGPRIRERTRSPARTTLRGASKRQSAMSGTGRDGHSRWFLSAGGTATSESAAASSVRLICGRQAERGRARLVVPVTVPSAKVVRR
jgi:hypothetical protein